MAADEKNEFYKKLHNFKTLRQIPTKFGMEIQLATA